MRQRTIQGALDTAKSGLTDFVLLFAKLIYGSTLVSVCLVGSMFLAALLVGVVAAPATAGFSGAMARGLEIITVVTESTGLQSNLYFSLLMGGFIAGAVAAAVYIKSVALISRARKKLN